MRTKERKVLDAADVLCGECPVIQKDDDLGQLCGMLKAMLLMGYDMTWFERFAK